MIKEEIVDLMGQDMGQALSTLKKAVKKDSPFYQEIILLEGALNDLNSHLRKGLISYTENLSEIGKLRHRLLSMIGEIPEISFVSNEVMVVPIEENDLGIFDHLVEGLKNLRLIFEIFPRLTRLIEELSEGIALDTHQIEHINQMQPNSQRKTILTQKIFESVGKKLNEYSEKVHPEVQLLDLYTKESMGYLDKAISNYYRFYDLEEEQRIELSSTCIALQNLSTASDAAIAGVAEFKRVLLNLPNYQIGFNKAKKGAVSQLENQERAIEYLKEQTLIFLDSLSILISRNDLKNLPADTTS